LGRHGHRKTGDTGRGEDRAYRYAGMLGGIVKENKNDDKLNGASNRPGAGKLVLNALTFD
jgi:hypothetical protein